ncbi:MAG: hypothetical protein AB9835_07495 [Eubacteriales bacterium]
MLNTKRLISLLLVLCLSLAFLPLSSCSGGDEDTAADTTAPTVQQEQSTTDEASARLAIPDDLPVKDYEGRAFRVLVRDNNWATCRHIEEIVAEEETGEVINDAVYKRNSIVEDRFNVKIEVVTQAEKDEATLTNFMRKTVLAGDDQFDLVDGHMILMGGLTTSDVFYNMYDLPYVNFDKPWWLKSATEELTVDGKSFFGISHLGYNALDYTYCYYFNKNLTKDYGIDNLYQTVRDGKWTIDYLNSLVKDIYKDTDANGKVDDTDFFGFATNAYSATVTYLWAFDNPVSKKNAEGIPELVLNTPKMPSIVTKLYDFYFNTAGVSVATKTGANGYGVDWSYYGNGAFKAGNAVFATGMFNDAIINYRDVDFDYGILPYPKWDEAQENYYTMMDGHGPLLAVPVTTTDPEFVSIILEAMSAEGYKIITPAYYEVALKTKYARDEETEEMLDLILEGRRFDFGYIYDGFTMSFCLQSLLSKENKDITSYYEKNEANAIKSIEKVVKAYQDYSAS